MSKFAYAKALTQQVMSVLNCYYAKIDNSIKIKHEKYYQTIFYIFFSLLNYRGHDTHFSEMSSCPHNSKGRMDAVLFTDTDIIIFEFKLDKPATEAIEQINQRGYAERFADDNRQITKIGISFTSQTGEIKEHIIE